MSMSQLTRRKFLCCRADELPKASPRIAGVSASERVCPFSRLALHQARRQQGLAEGVRRRSHGTHSELQGCHKMLSPPLMIFPRCDSDHCSDAPLDILIGGSPTGHADSHRRMPVPLPSPTPAGPLVLDVSDDPPRVLRAAERDEHLV